MPSDRVNPSIHVIFRGFPLKLRFVMDHIELPVLMNISIRVMKIGDLGEKIIQIPNMTRLVVNTGRVAVNTHITQRPCEKF